jgi:protein O-mannosyl-transferase
VCENGLDAFHSFSGGVLVLKPAKKKQRAAIPKVTVAQAPAEVRNLKPGRFFGWASLVSLLAGLCVYGPALKGPFIFDDFALPFRNPAFRAESLLDWMGSVRPVLMASYWLNFQISGRDSTASYHLISLLVHCANAVLAGAIILRLLLLAKRDDASQSQDELPPPTLPSFSEARKEILLAIFGAGIFLLHPLQTESVAYIAGRSESLSAFFCLAALAVSLYRRRIAISWGSAATVMLLFVAAAATKEHTVALAGILVLTDVFVYGSISFEPIRRNWRLYAPLVVAAGLAAAAAVWVLQRSESAGFSLPGLPWNHYFFSQLRAWFFYIWLFLFPSGLTVDHDFAVSKTLFEHGAILAAGAWIIAVAASVFLFRKYRLACYGLLLYLIFLLPTSSVVPIKDLVAERRLYLPILGLILMGLEAMRRVRITTPMATAALGAVLALLGLATYERSKDWADPVRLWNSAIAATPAKPRPYGNLASHYLVRRNCAQAEEVSNRASAILGKATDAHLMTTWGLALDCLGKKPEAIEKLKAAAAMQPGAQVYGALGRIHLELGRLLEAEGFLARAEQADPGWEMTYVYRGRVHAARDELEAAAVQYQRALAVNPANATARELLMSVQTRSRVK